MTNDPAVFLSGPGQEAGHVLEGDERDVERVAETHEASALDRSIDVEAAGEVSGLVPHDTDAPPAEASKPHDEVCREMLVNLEKPTLVHDRCDQLFHVVGLHGVEGHELVELRGLPVERVVRRSQRGLLQVVGGHEGEQLPDEREAGPVILHGELSHTRLHVVGHGSAELFLRHLLVGDRPDDIRPGDEHVRGALHHDVEVGDRGAVDRAPGAGAHDGRELRHHPGGEHVAQEDVGVASERGHTLLDAGPAGVVEPDHGGAHLDCEVHDLADLPCVGLGKAAPEHGEVLGEDVDEPAVDPTVARDDPVAGDLLLGHSEVETAVLDQLIELFEGVVVEKQLHALAGGQLALAMLALAALRTAPLLGPAYLVPEGGAHDERARRRPSPRAGPSLSPSRRGSA